MHHRKFGSYRTFTKIFRFLGTFAELRKKRVTISLIMSVCLSVCPHETIRLQLDGFSWSLIFQFFFRKYVEKIQISFKSDMQIVTRFLIISRWILFHSNPTWRPIHIFNNISLNSSWNKKYFRQNLQRKSKYIFCVQELFFFRKSCRLWDNVRKIL